MLEDKLQPVLRKLKFVQPGMGCTLFGEAGFSHLVYSGVSRQVIRECGHSSDKMVDHYTKMLRRHHAPEMAKVKTLSDQVGPHLDPTGRQESGTLVHRVVN